jgi:hypothetical protein
MVLSEFEKQALTQVSKERSWEHVQWFARTGQKLSGTLENERAVDYVLETLKKIGIRAQAPEYQSWLDFPKLFDAELRVTSPVDLHIEAMPLAQMAPTGSDGVEGELVYVGGGGLADYEEKNVRGKIVLVEFEKAPARPWKNYIAGVLKGAAGLIVISYNAPKRVFNRGTVKSVWGNPTPENIDEIGRIPALLITSEDGVRLEEMLARGPVRVWMRGDSERGWARTRQPMASIPGQEEGFVLLGSHMDAWASAGSCNAVGCACTLELARVLSSIKPLRRCVEFLWFQGHETGIMTGSTWYLDTHWDRIQRNCIAYLNDDTPCMVGTTVYSVDADPVYHDFMESTIKELAEYEGAPFKRIDGYTPWKAGDQSFLGVGVPSARVLTVTPPGEEEKPGGWWYHSDHDTIDKCDPETLYMANKAHLLVILRLCTLPIIPYSITPVADWTLAALNDLQNRAKGTIDLTSLIERGKDFRTVARRFDALTSEIAETIKSVGAAKKDEGRIAVTNRVMVKICRTLNPINYTLSGRYGQDHYGAEYIKPIPVLQPLSELAKLNPDTSQYKALRTKLVRERNRVADALEEAQWLAEHVL